MSLEQLDLFGNPILPAATKKEKPKLAQQPLFNVEAVPEIDEVKPSIFIEPKETVPTIDLHFLETISEEKKQTVPADTIEDITDLFVPKEATDQLQPFVYTDGNIRVKIKAKALKIIAEEPTPIPTKRAESEPIPHLQKRGRKSYKDLEASVDLTNIPDDETLSKKLYYGITEVANWFNVNVSQIRFWENEFDILQPRKTKKGDRLFRVEDIKNLELIYHLIRQRKFSIEGAKAYLKNNKQTADTNFELVQSLTKFRSFLLELKANLGT